ncbi:MAG: hypothetical protein F6K41_11975 [Symploca sp. SIO3E6]|nr:hypothetical protein [Caldora sp. SIO3E6]
MAKLDQSLQLSAVSCRGVALALAYCPENQSVVPPMLRPDWIYAGGLVSIVFPVFCEYFSGVVEQASCLYSSGLTNTYF